MRRDQGRQGCLFGAGEEGGPIQSAGASSPLPSEGESVQPQGDIASDDQGSYTYTGYVLDGGVYMRRQFRFTADELDIFPDEPLARVCAMVDHVGRDERRQAEIKRYGKRAWHSPYRPEDAATQGLDYIFRHDVELVAACLPCVRGFYAADPAQADRWTAACYAAYRAFVLRHERASLLHLLAEAGIPPQVVLGPHA